MPRASANRLLPPPNDRRDPGQTCHSGRGMRKHGLGNTTTNGSETTAEHPADPVALDRVTTAGSRGNTGYGPHEPVADAVLEAIHLCGSPPGAG